MQTTFPTPRDERNSSLRFRADGLVLAWLGVGLGRRGGNVALQGIFMIAIILARVVQVPGIGGMAKRAFLAGSARVFGLGDSGGGTEKERAGKHRSERKNFNKSTHNRGWPGSRLWVSLAQTKRPAFRPKVDKLSLLSRACAEQPRERPNTGLVVRPIYQMAPRPPQRRGAAPARGTFVGLPARWFQGQDVHPSTWVSGSFKMLCEWKWTCL